MNGLMDTVSWVLNYSGQDFILFYFLGLMVFGGWL